GAGGWGERVAAHPSCDHAPHAPDPGTDRALVGHRRAPGVRPDLPHDTRRPDVLDRSARHPTPPPGLPAAPHGPPLSDRGDPGRGRAVDRPGAGLRAARVARGGGVRVATAGRVRARRQPIGRRARVGRGVMWAVLLAALGLSLAPGLYMVSLSLMDNPQ